MTDPVDQLAARVSALEFALARAGLARQRGPRVTVAALIAWAAVASGHAADEIKGERRFLELARVRFAVVWAAHSLLHASWPRIGRALNRDHSTVIAAMRRAELLRETDAGFRDFTDRLVAAFEEDE